MNFKSILKGAFSLLLVSSLCSGVKANTVINGYFQANDAVKGPQGTGFNNDYYITSAGVSLPYASPGTPSVQSHLVTIDFSAYTTLVNGNSYNAPITVEGLNYATGGRTILWSGGATPIEGRYSLVLNVNNSTSSVGIYTKGQYTPSGYIPVLRLRDFRVRYTPDAPPYANFAPMVVNYSAPLDNQTLTGWPGITNTTNTGVGISGTISYVDARASTTDHVWVSIRRNSDGRWWTGTAWDPSYYKLAAQKTNTLWSTTQVPTGSNLTPGGYTIITSAHDKSDANFTSHYAYEKNIDVTFSSPTPTPTPPPADTVAPFPSTMTTPANGSTVSSVTTLSGNASDNAGGSGIKAVRVHLLLESNPLLEWNWTTRTWSTGYQNAPGTILTAPLYNGNTFWSIPSSALPSGSAFYAGRYTVRTYTDDNANHNNVYGVYGFTKSTAGFAAQSAPARSSSAPTASATPLPSSSQGSSANAS